MNEQLYEGKTGYPVEYSPLCFCNCGITFTCDFSLCGLFFGQKVGKTAFGEVGKMLLTNKAGAIIIYYALKMLFAEVLE